MHPDWIVVQPLQRVGVMIRDMTGLMMEPQTEPQSEPGWPEFKTKVA